MESNEKDSTFYKVKTNPIFSDFLLRIRNEEEHPIKDESVLLEHLVINLNGNSSVFNNRNISIIRLKRNLCKLHDRNLKTILASKNEYVGQLNKRLIPKFYDKKQSVF